MKFSVEWLENAANRAPEERATAAELQVWVGEGNATLHMSGEEPGNSVNMPVYALAEGLALDWWRLFGSREDEISLRHYRSGYAVPDVRMRFDGAAFEVRTEQTIYRNPNVRFWATQSEILSREKAEIALRRFVDKIVERLEQRGVVESTAALRWARVRASLDNSEERAFCEAAAALGEDPYAITDALTEVIDRSAAIFVGEALIEFLAGARGKDLGRLLGWIANARKLKDVARLDDLRGIAEQAAAAAPAIMDEPGWARGYRRARACRSALGLRDSDRFKSCTDLAARLGNKHYRAKHAVDGIRLLREDDDRGVILYLRKAAETEQMFSLARGIGDVACFPERDVAAVNDLIHAYRQRCGRAFAAELLAPVREVRSMREDGRDRLTIADAFGVSEMVIEHQLENAVRIEQACAA